MKETRRQERERERERGEEKRQERISRGTRGEWLDERRRRARREGRINETLNACATRRHGYGMPRLKRLTAKF